MLLQEGSTNLILEFFKTKHFYFLIERNLFEEVKKSVSPQEADPFGVQLGGEPGFDTQISMTGH